MFIEGTGNHQPIIFWCCPEFYWGIAFNVLNLLFPEKLYCFVLISTTARKAKHIEMHPFRGNESAGELLHI